MFSINSPQKPSQATRGALQECTPACPAWPLHLTARLLPVFFPTHVSQAPGAPCLLPLLVILPGLQQAAPRLPPQGLWRPPFCLESQIRPSGKFPRSVPDLAVCLWPQCSEGAGSRLTSLSAPALLLSPEFGCGFVLAREKALRIPWGGAQVCGVPRLRGPRLASFGTPFVSGARRAALTRVISAPSVLYATGYPRCQVRKPHLRDLVTG